MKQRIVLGLLGAGLLAASFPLMQWDAAGFNALYLRPQGLVRIGQILSALAAWYVVIPAAALSLAVLWRPGWIALALRPALFAAVTAILAEAGKMGLGRPHPDALVHTDFYGASFPSDHAATGMAFWFALTQVIGAIAPATRHGLTAAGAALALAIGWSQVFLGVNWPADVIAGWGLALLLFGLAPAAAAPKAGRVKAKK